MGGERAEGLDGVSFPISSSALLVSARRPFEIPHVIQDPRAGTDVQLNIALEIRRLRVSMWKTVRSRKHHLEKVFPANFDVIVDMNAAEFMMYGSVAYQSKTAHDDEGEKGVEEKVDWAAHAMLRRDGINGAWGFEYYRVYLQR